MQNKIVKVVLAQYEDAVNFYKDAGFVYNMTGQVYKEATDKQEGTMPWCVIQPSGQPEEWFIFQAY